MKTIFKFSVFIVLSFTAAVALMNWDSFKLFADTGKRMIEKKIDEAQSMETKLNLLETKIQGLDKEILELKTEVVRRKVDVEYMEKILTEKELAQLNLKESLESASALLERKRDHYVIGHRRYSFEDVARDAEEKMKLFKIQEETLNNLKRTLDTKQKTLAIAEQNVAKGEGIKAELNAKVKHLAAQVERFKAKEVYAETQLKVKDRLLDERIRLGGDYVGGIDYSEENTSDSEDIAGEISKYFKADREASVAMEE